MRNIKLTIMYDGKDFNGWQKQPNKLNIQGTIEKVISEMTGEEIELNASGRTDAGVHSFGQVANFKTNSKIPIDKFPIAINSKIKKSKLTKNKNISFNPLKYTIDGYTLLVGRNNKENDYLTLKYAKKTDLWFHTKDIHGSHAILLVNNKTPDTDILIKCAQITAYHSKARNSSNVPVDFCEAKYVKKPNGAKPGMVIYTNNQTLNVNPRI